MTYRKHSQRELHIDIPLFHTSETGKQEMLVYRIMVVLAKYAA